MYRPYLTLASVLLLSGCAALEHLRSSLVAPSTLTGPYQSEKQSLFTQPFIDPLTDYLIEHQGDPARQSVVREVRQERDRRCDEIARQYSGEPATQPVLERYNIGYGYSCPQQVAAFEQRLKRQPPEPPPEPAAQPQPAVVDQAPTAEEMIVSDQALSDCYLLTSIRNFSEARAVCRLPAENGDVRAQTNMAVVAHAFEDYASALSWAEKAAPESAQAAFLLGQMYATGRGVSQNVDRAVYWYQQAARQGHSESQAILDRRSEGPAVSDP